MNAVQSAPAVDRARSGMGLLWIVIGAAWLLAAALHLVGGAEALHHDELIEGGTPLLLAVPVFLVAWQVMVVSMMLPASVPTIGAFRTQWHAPRPAWAVVLFIGAYALAWTAFGLVAFAGDVVTHAIVEATPWLEERSWLIQAGVLALAGAYQFLPIKRRALAACRQPEETVMVRAGLNTAAVSGLRHAAECVISSWALMLLMFAAGVANIWWMVALAVAMTYEAIGRHGHRATPVIGLVLLAFASTIVLTGGAIGISAH